MDLETVRQMRERLLVCSICMDEYKDPRILPCHHSFCLECIASLIGCGRNAHKSFDCPQCRINVQVPNGEIKKLPVNFYLVSLQDELGAKAKEWRCNICTRENVYSQFHCVDCDKYICKFCISAHRLEEHTERSKVVRLTKSALWSLSNACLFCENHSNEILQLFCHTCHHAICVTCSCNAHKHHKLVPLSKQLEKSKIFMQEELDKITLEMVCAIKAKASIEAMKKNIMKASEKSILNLENIALMACGTIMKIKADFEEEINSSLGIQCESIDNVESHLQSYTDMLYKGQDLLSDMQDHDVCMEVVDSYKKFMADLSEKRSQYTSSCVPIQYHNFLPSQSIKVIDINVGIARKPAVLGTLGSLRSKKLKMFVDSKTLEVRSTSGGLTKSLFFHLLLKILVFVVSFLFFIYMFDVLDKTIDIIGCSKLAHFMSNITSTFEKTMRVLSLLTH